jgi:hypothetical protein
LGLIGLGIAIKLYQPSPISPNTNKASPNADGER